tara:strand:- start:6615 stop:6926 length:312 start_codon:yes stop_codon:yes gene_type:complete
MPMLVLILGVTISLFLSVFIPHQLSQSQIFTSIVNGAIKLAPLVLYSSLFISAIWSLIQTYQLWQWKKGNTEVCFNCGGLVTQKDGRYGAYSHCLACGKNRSN